MSKPLWTCPKCGKQFVTRNMSHSCVSLTADAFFAGKHAHLRPVYDAYLAFVERTVGSVIVNVDKTRISFQNRGRFAGVAALRKDALVASFWLKRQIENPRFSRVDFYPPSNWVYQFRIRDGSELDDEVALWLREAYLVGNQEYRPE